MTTRGKSKLYKCLQNSIYLHTTGDMRRANYPKLYTCVDVPATMREVNQTDL